MDDLKTESEAATGCEASAVERLVITGVAMLYQRQTKTGWDNKVRCVLVPTEENDDEYDLKAKAERHIAEDEKLSEEIKDYNLVAWNTATQI